MTIVGEPRSGTGSISEGDRWATLVRFAEELFAVTSVDERVRLIADQAKELSQASKVTVQLAQPGKPPIQVDVAADPSQPETTALKQVLLSGRGAEPLGFISLDGNAIGHSDPVVAHYLQIASSSIDNARLFDQCQEAIRAREEILAIVSHDLRTPLNAIALGAHVLSRITLDEQQRAVKLAQVLEAVRHAARLIDDLLEIAHIDAGQLSLDCRQCHAPSMVSEAVEMLRPTLDTSSVSLSVSVPEDLPPLRADPIRVTQVIQNVLDNALRVSNESVCLTVERVGQEVRIAVCDTGPGIPQEDLPRLFERYWQGRKKVRGRVGLGLSIAQGIVEAHGGRIWAENGPGKGATVYFTLPLAEPA